MSTKVTRTKSATQYHNLGQHHVYKRVTFQDVNAQGTTGKNYIGGIPAYAMPEEVIVRIRTTFDVDLVVGTSSDADAYATSNDIIAGTTGTYVTDRPYGSYSTVDVALFASMATTGSTVGSADVWVTFRQAEPSTD